MGQDGRIDPQRHPLAPRTHQKLTEDHQRHGKSTHRQKNQIDHTTLKSKRHLRRPRGHPPGRLLRVHLRPAGRARHHRCHRLAGNERSQAVMPATLGRGVVNGFIDRDPRGGDRQIDQLLCGKIQLQPRRTARGRGKIDRLDGRHGARGGGNFERH